MKNIQEKLIDFIDETPNSYYCVDNIKRILDGYGFKELYEYDDWKYLGHGDYYVIRNDSSLIAFREPNELKSNTGFNIVATHSDSPSFSIKNFPEIYDGSYLKLNILGYGGMINYSWLDRPLSIAGRVIVCKDNEYQSQLININKDLLIIPSQAIHINREVNEKNELNHQMDLLPIMSLSNNTKLDDIIGFELQKQHVLYDRICDGDLYLYNRDKSKIVGLTDEFILAPRLDDLGCLYPALDSFINTYGNSSINVFCAFNNEEIGSLTRQGADSTFLYDVLSRISSVYETNFYASLENSLVVSADNAHAMHPNATSKNDLTNKVVLNGGIAIKHHTNYTTDGISSSLFKGMCEEKDIPYQDFECRSDMRCGSTLGGLSQSHVSVNSVDIGLPQLAMHSANETIGYDDVKYMNDALSEFYSSSIIKEKGKIKIIK